jgi:HEPN domain-containing protein
VSSPGDEPAERAAVLGRKAQADATATRKFAGDPEITDDIVGFHAQQAVEKWLKAVIASRGQSFEYKHDIDRLIEVLTADGQEIPLKVDQLIALTEYAVPLRYEDLLDAEPLDRDGAVALVAEVSEWAASQLCSSRE